MVKLQELSKNNKNDLIKAIFSVTGKEMNLKFKDGRVNFIAPADYTENSKIDLIIKDLLTKISLNNKIETYSK